MNAWIHRGARIAAIAWPLLLPAAPGPAHAVSCSPAPCVVPNVRVTSGADRIIGGAMAVNPTDGNNMVVVSDDFNCWLSRRGIYVSADRGSTWSTHCVTTPPGSRAWEYAGFATTYNRLGYAYVASVNSDGSGISSFVSVQVSVDRGGSFGSPVTAVPAASGTHTLRWRSVIGAAAAERGSPRRSVRCTDTLTWSSPATWPSDGAERCISLT